MAKESCALYSVLSSMDGCRFVLGPHDRGLRIICITAGSHEEWILDLETLNGSGDPSTVLALALDTVKQEALYTEQR
jgi:hypothetical protein